MGLVTTMEIRPADEALPQGSIAPLGAESSTETVDAPAWVVPEAVLADPDGASDGDLVRGCIAGETGLFGALVKRYTGMIISFARSRLGSADVAEEVAQEVMVRAYEELLKLKAPRSFSNWLLGIANHVIIRIHRQRGQEPSLVGVDGFSGGAGGTSPLHPGVAGGSSEDERWEGIVAEVNSLPPRYRVVVVLKHLQGMSCKDIADRLAVPMGTVTGRLSRAYAMLRGKLVPGGTEMEGDSDDLQ